jgi:two-component system cell cycle sensor histidine kinase/response regulator CckA
MDDELVLEGVLPYPDAAGGPKRCPTASSTAVPVARKGPSAGALEVFKRLLSDLPGVTRDATLAVHDTGIGTDEVRVHIFEPFLKTTTTVKGAGLRLTTVLRTIEQSGAISCESGPDRGTAFTILLPAVSTAAHIAAPSPAGGMDKAPRGSEVILLVEDDDMVRGLARTILETSGYVVLNACDGREGLTICETNEGPIDLLLSDVVMPVLCGRELAEHAVKLRPAMKIMFMSGYVPDVILKETLQKGIAFLQKPFTPVELARKVRETLDAETESSSSAPVTVRIPAEPGGASS